jgi:hypothetical protein
MESHNGLASAPKAVFALCCLIVVGTTLKFDASGAEPIQMLLAVVAATVALLLAAVIVELRYEDLQGMKAIRWAVCSTFVTLALIGSARPLLHISFSQSVPVLDRLGNRLQRGEKFSVPVRVGSFMVVGAELRNGEHPMLHLSSDASGSTSFVRSTGVPGNAWSHIRLSPDWLLFSED